MLSITYKNGRGRASIDLDQLLPCSAADMKTLLTFADLAADPDGTAESIYNHIAEKVSALKEDRAFVQDDSALSKKKLTKINCQIRKYLANAAIISRAYGFEEMTDAAADIRYTSATVYYLKNEDGAAVVKSCSGWTFEKGGYTFDVYKEPETKARYNILLHGTGLACAFCSNKSGAAAEITPRLLDILKNGSEKIDAAKAEYIKLMTAAGYMDPAEDAEPEPERRETILETENETEKAPADPAETENAEKVNKRKEEKEMANYSFTGCSLTCKGKTFTCEYNISDSGAVLVFVTTGTMESGRHVKQKIVFKPDHPDHAAALAAAKQAAAPVPRRADHKGAPVPRPVNAAALTALQEAAESKKRPETISIDSETAAGAFDNVPVIDTATGETVTENAADLIREAPAADPAPKKPEPKAAAADQAAPEPKKPARDPKAARGAVPEKTFIGETIQGNGWKIYFDGDAARTRVIFDKAPRAAAHDAVKAAGFYYSGAMKSWNKKLTFKAYRAALALSGQLSKIYAA